MRHVFFGLQIAVRCPSGDAWRRELRDLLRDHARDLPTQDTRALLASLANLLLRVSDRWTLGFWDYAADGKAAYDEWVQGIEDDSAESWVEDRSGAALDHVLVSVALLAPGGSAGATFLGERCDLQEGMWQRRASYRWLVEGLSRVPIAHVSSASAYVTPGSLLTAFAKAELGGTGYDYLLPIG